MKMHRHASAMSLHEPALVGLSRSHCLTHSMSGCAMLCGECEAKIQNCDGRRGDEPTRREVEGT